MKICKHYSAILLVLLLYIPSFAQLPALEDLPRQVQREYRKDLREAQREADRQERQNWDIIMSPIEVPLRIQPDSNSFSAQAIISWQSKLQRIAELKQRIQQECKYPIHLKISDSGVDQSHPDLAAGFTGEKDWTGQGLGFGTHGTHVAGCALQYLYPLVEIGLCTYDDQKSLRSEGSGSFSWSANMLLSELQDTKNRTAAGQTVFWNFSWSGGTQIVSALEAAMKQQVEAGAIIIAAAGNTAAAVNYPGNSQYTICVSSIDENMNISSFSSRGPEVDVTAGGRLIISTIPGGQYAAMSGTSMASPSLAGILAYAYARWGRSAFPNYDALLNYLKKVATKVGDGNIELYGAGYAYIEAILNTPPDGNNPPPDPDPEPPTTLAYSAGILSGKVMRWRYEDESAWRIISIERMTWETACQRAEDECHASAATFADEYFLNRGIVMPRSMGNYSVAWWTGQFLEYAAKNDGLEIDVIDIEARSEEGSRLYARNFDRAASRSILPTPKLVYYELP